MVPHNRFNGPDVNPSENKLLASLPSDTYQRISAQLRTVPMPIRRVIQKQDERIDDVLVPKGGALSLVKTLRDGLTGAVATIGAEGVVGASVFFGQEIAECDVIVQVEGFGAHAMRADAFKREMASGGPFFNRVVRYNQALMSQIIQTAVCNELHSAKQRCCRWLLTLADRAGSLQLPMTHEILATTLGLRRPTVTIAMVELQRTNVIERQRGSVKIINRQALEAVSCECYRALKDQMTRLLSET